MKKVLIFPGAFNPPHLGHATCIQKVLKNYSFDEVWIVPSGKRDDKVISTSYETRRELNSLFVAYLNTVLRIPAKLLVDELNDTEGKYTHEILQKIKSQSNIEFTQLIGIDGIIYLRKSLSGKEFIKENFIVINRIGYELPKDMLFGDNVIFTNESSGEISSTTIRAMAQNKNPEYEHSVPPKIATYIKEHKLYQ